MYREESRLARVPKCRPPSKSCRFVFRVERIPSSSAFFYLKTSTALVHMAKWLIFEVKADK